MPCANGYKVYSKLMGNKIESMEMRVGERNKGRDEAGCAGRVKDLKGDKELEQRYTWV